MQKRIQDFLFTVTQKELCKIVTIDSERVKQILSEPNPAHRHEYQEIIVVESGTIEHQLDDVRETIPAFAAVVIPKGRIHLLDPSPDFQGTAIRFHDEFLPKDIPQLLGPLRPLLHCHLSDKQMQEIMSIIYLMNAQHRADFTSRWLLMAILSMLQEWQPHSHEVSHKKCNPDLQIWQQLEKHLEAKYTQKIHVSEFAQLLNRTEKSVNELTKKYAGKTMSELIDTRRILEAKRLLLYSNENLKEIAFKVGFEDHSYFARVFKKHNQQTPSDFRQFFLGHA